jgi:hypothetical protein
MIDPQALELTVLIAASLYGWAWAIEQWDDKDWQ